MKISRFAAGFLAAAVFASSGASYRTALPGYAYQFPRDHFSHPDFQTEWWYYTGNLRSSTGARFGFELTFFRHAIDRGKNTTVWDVQDVWLGHLALSDIDGGRFFHAERLNRSGPGLAGADGVQARVWNGNWSVRSILDSRAPGGIGQQELAATDSRFQLSLSLRPMKAPMIHGLNGVSQKAEGAGRASHYISYTRLATQGSVTVHGKRFEVEGLAWMDHEFFTHQLDSNQSGWDWFSLQFDDGSELMLFRLRRKDGAADPYSAGTYVDPQGHERHLTHDDFAVIPGETWTSPDTGGKYPVAWTLRVASLGLDCRLSTALPRQELTPNGRGTTAYWEGAIEVAGERSGNALKGAGYLEMTGYAGPVRMGE